MKITLALSLIILLWSLVGLADELVILRNCIPNAIDYLSGSWPPDFAVLPSLADPIIETVQMGFLGVALASAIAVPLSLAAAKSTSPSSVVYAVSRTIINICRSIPTLLWAILFVSAVGLGPTAGILALATHCIGSLGKYFSECIESIFPKIADTREAMQVDGANSAQVIIYGLLPAVAPLFLSYIAYYAEWSIRAGTILGMVGAGGVGLRLTTSIRMFRRKEAAAIVLVVLALVTVIDGVSGILRRQLAST